jgi:hypothetical protein
MKRDLARFGLAILSGAMSFLLCSCKPADPSSDLIKTQRQALDQAKAVEGLLQQSQDRSKALEDEQK